MRLDHPFDDLFRNRSHIRLLRVLHELPDGLSVSARELGRRAEVSHPTASRTLASLVELGIVRVRRTPRVDLFELNRGHVLIERIRDLFEWESRLPDEFLAFLGREIEQIDGISAAFVFGTAARGQMTPTSDIDLAVLCAPEQAAVVQEALEDVAEIVRSRFGSRLNFVVGTARLEQLAKPGRSGHRLWERVAQEGIPLLNRKGARGHG